MTGGQPNERENQGNVHHGRPTGPHGAGRVRPDTPPRGPHASGHGQDRGPRHDPGSYAGPAGPGRTGTTGGVVSAASRRQRGNDAARWYAEYCREHGWPHAEATGAGRGGVDVTGMPGLSVEVKATAEMRIQSW